VDKLKARLDLLESKIRNLVERVEEYRTENIVLKGQVSDFQNIIENQKKQIKESGERNNLVKIAETVTDDVVGNEDLRKKIDKYVKEIDKCIALLNE